MSHVRTQIRNQIVAYVTGLATTGSNVFTGLSERIVVDKGRLPCLLVYFGEDTEASEHDSMGNLDRQLRVVIKGLTYGVNPEDELNQIAAEVEAGIVRTVAGLAYDAIPIETKIMDGAETADADYGAIEIVYLIGYRTAVGLPETAL